MDVTMPDDTLVQGVPDGITKSQLLAKYQKFSAPQSPQEPGIASRIGSDLSNFGNQMANSVVANMKGEQSIPSTALQIAGGVGAGLMDVGTEAAKGLANSMPDFVKKGASAVGNYLGDTDTAVYALDKANQLGNTYSGFAKENPVAARNIGAVANIEGGLLIASGLNNARGALADVGENSAQSLALPAGNFPKAMAAPLNPIPPDVLKNASQNAYKYSENVGGVLNPDTFTNDALDIIDKAKAKPIAGKVLTSEQKSLNNALDEYSPLRDSPLTLEDYQNFDKSLGAKETAAMNGFTPTNNSRIIGQVQDSIRERLQNLKQSDVIGDKEGFDALTEHAIPLWSAQTKMADLETLLNRAKGTLNPAQSTRTALNNLINSPKFKLYPNTVQSAIKDAAQRGSGDELLGMVGSRLNPIVNNTLAGKAVNFLTAGTARKVRNAVQETKNAKILSAMTDPVRASVEKFSTLPDSPYPLKPEVPTVAANPYINENAGQLSKFLPNSQPEVPTVGGVEPIKEPQGTESTYFKKGGSVKEKNLTAEFLAKASKR